MLVIVAPGQGAQAPGFLTPWLESATFAERLHWLGAVADLDLVHYGTRADADTIRDTSIAQPLLVAAALGTLGEVIGKASTFSGVGAYAGHSVGELAAAAAAGVLTPEQAMVLVRERGRAMAQAAAATPTSMTALLGGTRDDVLAKLEQHGLTAANENGPGQIVAAGTIDQLAALAADGPAGARQVPLSVAGAFHTEHMQSAVATVGRLAAATQAHEPHTRLISNRDGHVVTDGPEFLERVITQIGSPVRWDLCMETMRDLGVTGLLELAPGGTLTGIAKRALRGVATFALKTPDQLEAARAFVAEHRESATEGFPVQSSGQSSDQSSTRNEVTA